MGDVSLGHLFLHGMSNLMIFYQNQSLQFFFGGKVHITFRNKCEKILGLSNYLHGNPTKVQHVLRSI